MKRSISLLLWMILVLLPMGAEASGFVDELENFSLMEGFSSNIVNNGDSYLSKLGDSSVLNCSSENTSLPAYMMYQVEKDYVILFTAYQYYNCYDEFTFSFSVEGNEWSEVAYERYDTVVANDKQYYKVCYHVTVPENGYLKINWPTLNTQNHWKYLAGKVSATKAQYSYTDLCNDFSNLYKASYHITSSTNGLVRKTSEKIPGSYSEQYYPYTEEQFVIYQYHASQYMGTHIEVDTLQSSSVSTASGRFRLETSSDLINWTTAEYDLKITYNSSATMHLHQLTYDDDVQSDKRYLKIIWPAEATTIWGPTIRQVSVEPQELTQISKLKYYLDGERIYETPSLYNGELTVTGMIKNLCPSQSIQPMVYGALYDSDGVMKNVTGIKISSIAPNEEAEFLLRIQAENITSFRLFVWQDLVPLCDSLHDVIYRAEEFEPTGEEFLDPLDDWTNTYYHGANLKFEKPVDSAALGYDTSLVTKRYPLNESIKYHISDIQGVQLQLFICDDYGNNLRLLGSTFDGDYKELTVVKTIPQKTASNWKTVTYTVTDVPEDINFLKIEMPWHEGAAWSQQIGWVKIIK